MTLFTILCFAAAYYCFKEGAGFAGAIAVIFAFGTMGVTL
jgi:hypothetical protein